MISIRFHPEADAEMMSAAVFYEKQQKYLGKRFLAIETLCTGKSVFHKPTHTQQSYISGTSPFQRDSNAQNNGARP